jgi:hypothetical protein
VVTGVGRAGTVVLEAVDDTDGAAAAAAGAAAALAALCSPMSVQVIVAGRMTGILFAVVDDDDDDGKGRTGYMIKYLFVRR